MNIIAELTDRTVIAISGPDRYRFLQGLISNDIHKAERGLPVFAAMLSPQGKFLHDFFIVSRGETLWMDVAKAGAADLIKRLQTYKLRSDIKIEDLSTYYKVFASWSQQPLVPFETIVDQGVGHFVDGVVYADPRHVSIEARGIIKYHAPLGIMVKYEHLVDAVAYNQHRIRHGIPVGGVDVVPDRSILLECGYDELNAIDFNKGCYVGQEVTARSKHRATIRKFIHQVSSSGEVLPPAGTVVMLEGKEVGEIRSSVGNIGLAMLRVEDVVKATLQGANLMAGKTIISARLPEWVKTPFAEAS